LLSLCAFPPYAANYRTILRDKTGLQHASIPRYVFLPLDRARMRIGVEAAMTAPDTARQV